MISLSSCSLVNKPLLMFQQATLISWFLFLFSCFAFLFGFIVLSGSTGSGFSTETGTVHLVEVQRGSGVDELGGGGTLVDGLPLLLVPP